MKPMIILPPEAMSKEDIELLRANDICVVVAKEPALVKFVDPIPASSSRTEIEQAAIQLSRKLLQPGAWNHQNWTSNDADMRRSICMKYIDILVQGTSLSVEPTREERERAAYNAEKIDALRRLAREDAKKEHEANKAAKVKAKAPTYEDKEATRN